MEYIGEEDKTGLANLVSQVCQEILIFCWFSPLVWNIGGAGGLGLPCIVSMSDSLFLNQTSRLLLISDLR